MKFSQVFELSNITRYVKIVKKLALKAFLVLNVKKLRCSWKLICDQSFQSVQSKFLETGSSIILLISNVNVFDNVPWIPKEYD